jgi:hypothetical protein
MRRDVKAFQKFDDCARESARRVDATLMDNPSRRSSSIKRTSGKDQDRLNRKHRAARRSHEPRHKAFVAAINKKAPTK